MKKESSAASKLRSPVETSDSSSPITLRRGPTSHRFLVWFFAALVAVLAFWLLGYLNRDIDDLEGPNYDTLVTQKLPSALIDQSESLAKQIDDTRVRIESLTKQRELLQQSVSNSQQTINQLLDLQKLSIENEAALSDDQEEALSSNLQAFLDRQAESQRLGTEVEGQSQALRLLLNEKRVVEEQLQTARLPLIDVYQGAVSDHEWKLAGYKLLILLPLLTLIAFAWWKSVGTPFAALMYAFAASVGGRAILVMHQHFPSIIFRYLLFGTALFVATWILFRLLKSITEPSQKWLLKQYRDAYAMFQCPICEFPIRRGPMRFTSWTQKTLRKSLSLVSAADSTEGDEAYTCPCCGTQLFESCSVCNKTRASLLPACDKCGDKKAIAALPVT